jgi:hypothetical protein
VPRPLRAFCTVLGMAFTAYGVSPVQAAETGAEVAFRLTDERILESSGLAASGRHRDVVWTFNDSGDEARIFAVGRRGRTLAVQELAGQEPRDWEAIAPGVDDDGRPALFVGDIGDNSETRDHGILVHRVTEPADLSDGTLEPTFFRLRYPDGPHDAETLLVHPETNRLYVVTKGFLGGSIYQAPEVLDPSAPNVLERVDSAPSLVTDGAYLPDGRYVLRDYYSAFVYAADRTLERRIELPRQEQGESVTVTPDGAALLVGSEGERSEVWRVLLAETPATSSAQPTEEGGDSGDFQPQRIEIDRTMYLWAGGALAALVVLALAWIFGRLSRRR